MCFLQRMPIAGGRESLLVICKTSERDNFSRGTVVNTRSSPPALSAVGGLSASLSMRTTSALRLFSGPTLMTVAVCIFSVIFPLTCLLRVMRLQEAGKTLWIYPFAPTITLLWKVIAACQAFQRFQMPTRQLMAVPLDTNESFTQLNVGSHVSVTVILGTVNLLIEWITIRDLCAWQKSLPRKSYR